jgi:uncharacterized protein (TIGR02001 family)
MEFPVTVFLRYCLCIASRYWRFFCCLLGFALMFPTLAGAQSITTSANVALSSDYIYRGISQTGGGPAISGGFDAQAGNFSAGVWGSSVDFNDATTMELDLYANYAARFAGLDFSLGGIAYFYPDSPKGQNFIEANASLGKTFGPLELGATYAFSPDFYGNTGNAGYLTLDASWTLDERWSVSGGYGYQQFYQTLKGGDSYYDINAGITLSLSDFNLDLRYHDAFALAGVTGSSVVVLALSRSF